MEILWLIKGSLNEAGSLNRVQLLQWVAAGPAGLQLLRGAWAQVEVSSIPFGLSVACGPPTHDSEDLSTQLMQPALQAPNNLGVFARLEVAGDDKFTWTTQTVQSLVLLGLAYLVYAEVQGLAPRRWYFYHFMAGGAVSTVGRARTFPVPDAAAAGLRLAYASCQCWERGYYFAYRHMAQENLDLAVFLGDYIF